MTAFVRIEKPAAAAAGSPWRLHLAALGLAAAALLTMFRHDAADMVRIWVESSTFNHCMLIVPIIGWLVWQRVPELRRLVPGVCWPGLLLVGAGAATWLLGSAGGVALLRHGGLILMLQGAVVACLGPAVARGLLFPLFYMVFLVPAGEEIVPLMQTVTARMCMLLLDLVGIPAHLDGVFITTPTAAFEVAEACSGVKFLVAMIAYGALVANLCFCSWTRRLLFMIAAVAIPIGANGIRAWGTIYVASRTSVDFAVGFDHVLYGWIFFGIVIAAVMAVGWRFFDRAVGDPWFDPARIQPVAPAMGQRLPLILAATIAVAALPIAWSAALAAAGTAPVPARFAMPAPPGWHRISVSRGRPWQPHYAGADTLQFAYYGDGNGREVELAIAVFARQREGRELVAFGQGPVGPQSHWAWTANGAPPPNGRLDRITSFGTIREVASFYRVGEILTGNPVEVKLETMKVRLLGGRQRAVAVLVSAQAPGDGLSPRPAIDSFLAALGPIDRLADRAAGAE